MEENIERIIANIEGEEGKQRESKEKKNRQIKHIFKKFYYKASNALQNKRVQKEAKTFYEFCKFSGIYKLMSEGKPGEPVRDPCFWTCCLGSACIPEFFKYDKKNEMILASTPIKHWEGSSVGSYHFEEAKELCFGLSDKGLSFVYFYYETEQGYDLKLIFKTKLIKGALVIGNPISKESSKDSYYYSRDEFRSLKNKTINEIKGKSIEKIFYNGVQEACDRDNWYWKDTWSKLSKSFRESLGDLLKSFNATYKKKENIAYTKKFYEQLKK